MIDRLADEVRQDSPPIVTLGSVVKAGGGGGKYGQVTWKREH